MVFDTATKRAGPGRSPWLCDSVALFRPSIRLIVITESPSTSRRSLLKRMKNLDRAAALRRGEMNRLHATGNRRAALDDLGNDFAVVAWAA